MPLADFCFSIRKEGKKPAESLQQDDLMAFPAGSNKKNHPGEISLNPDRTQGF
jgi:hypothetical protein